MKIGNKFLPLNKTFHSTLKLLYSFASPQLKTMETIVYFKAILHDKINHLNNIANGTLYFPNGSSESVLLSLRDKDTYKDA